METEWWHLLAKGDLSIEVWNFLQIASALEQKGQKELQNKHHGSVRAVMATYSKLFMTCRDEMYVVVLTLICCLISVSKLSHLCCSQHKADDFWKSPGVPPNYSHWICWDMIFLWQVTVCNQRTEHDSDPSWSNKTRWYADSWLQNTGGLYTLSGIFSPSSSPFSTFF